MRTLLLLGLVACKSGTAPFPDSDTDTAADTDVPVAPLVAPEADGPYGFELTLIDIPGEDRPMPTRVYVPDGPLGPVAMVFPGYLIPADMYDSYGAHLATHGYTTFVVDLPGGVGNLRRTHRQMAVDVAYAMNFVEAQTRIEGIDPYNVYVVAHSQGAKVTLLRATEDQRIRAVVALDPVDVAPAEDPVEYPSVTPERMGAITIPVAYVGEQNNTADCAPAAESFTAFYAAAAGPALMVDVLGADHTSWLDQPDCGFLCNTCTPGTDDPLVTKQISRGIAISFFEHVRLARPGAREHFTTLTDRVNAGLVTVESKNGL
ncbi:MAG: alpha/beta fold hydrolase [Alphaproteobacteria bacterium]|nr:alpha/beta fold hydrolase [Alphaproteobacteria bacterium]